MAAPQSAARSFIGVYKDTVNATLSTNYAASTSSFVLQNIVGTPTSSMTVTIVDGYLTEQLAITCVDLGHQHAGHATASANAHSANVYCFFQTTSGIGPTALMRATKIEFDDNYDNKLYDTGFRGSPGRAVRRPAGHAGRQHLSRGRPLPRRVRLALRLVLRRLRLHRHLGLEPDDLRLLPRTTRATASPPPMSSTTTTPATTR